MGYLQEKLILLLTLILLFVGGRQHRNNGVFSSIIGGDYNLVNSLVYRSVILGGSYLTASADDTVYTPNIVATGSLILTGSAEITGGVTGSSFTGSFVGDGSGLTGISSVSLGTNGQIPYMNGGGTDFIYTSGATISGTYPNDILKVTSNSTDAITSINLNGEYTKIQGGGIIGKYNYTTPGTPLMEWKVTRSSLNAIIFGTSNNYHTAIMANNTAHTLFDKAGSVNIGYGDYTTLGGGKLSVKGSGSTAATTTLLLQNSSNTELLRVRDDGTISGSVFSGSFVGDGSGLTGIGGGLDINTTVNSGSTVVYTFATASLDGGFVDYVLKESNSGSRAGNIMSVWSGASIEYNEVITLDFGDTSTVTFSMDISGENARLIVDTIYNNWRLKAKVREILEYLLLKFLDRERN